MEPTNGAVLRPLPLKGNRPATSKLGEMDFRTSALVVAILVGSLIIAGAIYFQPQPKRQEVTFDANPCGGNAFMHPDFCH
jgi:hypothetical protein